MNRPSSSCGGWPGTTTTRPSRRSWPNRNAAPPPACRSPEPGWRSCAPTTASRSTSRRPSPMSDPTTMMPSWSPPPKLRILAVSKETLYRWIRDGFITAEQITPSAPWRIRLDQALRDRIQPEAPDGWLGLDEAAKALGVARQTVLHKVQRGELQAVHVNRGRRKGLRIQVKPDQPGLFDTTDRRNAQC